MTEETAKLVEQAKRHTGTGSASKLIREMASRLLALERAGLLTAAMENRAIRTNQAIGVMHQELLDRHNALQLKWGELKLAAEAGSYEDVNEILFGPRNEVS